MRVLVTGASGFLGGAVARGLISSGHDVTVLQRGASGLPCREVRGDIADEQALGAALQGAESVIHLAAKVAVSGDHAEFTRINVTGTSRMIEAARAAGVRRFVQVSSPSVAHAGTPLVGAGADPANPATARGSYSQTKAESELIALAADTPGFAVVAIRPHLVWGPGDEQLVGRIVARARAGRLFLIDGGVALIDTTYIDNAVTALVASMAHAEDPEVHGRAFVVSNGQPRTVAELLTRMARAAGAPEPARSVPFRMAWLAGTVAERAWRHHPRGERAGDPPMTAFLAEQLATAHWFDMRETERVLGWAPMIGLDEGFTRLAAWYDAQGAAVED
jgi:nucleoside-diphosphate-sugar epimerase